MTTILKTQNTSLSSLFLPAHFFLPILFPEGNYHSWDLERKKMGRATEEMEAIPQFEGLLRSKQLNLRVCIYDACTSTTDDMDTTLDLPCYGRNLRIVTVVTNYFTMCMFNFDKIDFVTPARDPYVGEFPKMVFL